MSHHTFVCRSWYLLFASLCYFIAQSYSWATEAPPLQPLEMKRRALEHLRDVLADYEREGLPGREQAEKKLGTQRTRRLLAALGSPQERLRAVHVAGSKGKGSVCAIVSSLLVASGYHRLGVFASPHGELSRYLNSERLRKNHLATLSLLKISLLYRHQCAISMSASALPASLFPSAALNAPFPRSRPPSAP